MLAWLLTPKREEWTLGDLWRRIAPLSQLIPQSDFRNEWTVWLQVFISLKKVRRKEKNLLSAVSVSLLVCFCLWMQRSTSKNWVVEYQRRLSHLPWPASGSALPLPSGRLRSFGGVSEEFQGWGLLCSVVEFSLCYSLSRLWDPKLSEWSERMRARGPHITLSPCDYRSPGLTVLQSNYYQDHKGFGRPLSLEGNF